MNLFAIFIYAMWHILLPGESTPILVALRMIGTKRSSILKIGLGLGLSNGLVIVTCLSLGVFFSASLDRYATFLSILIRILGILVFFIVATYILFRLKVCKNIEASPSIIEKSSFIEKHALKSGLLIGIIPSLADLGFLLIGSMISPKKLGLAVIFIWLGVLISFTLVGFILCVIPIQILGQRGGRYSQWLHLIASISLILIGLWLGYTLWADYSYIF